MKTSTVFVLMLCAGALFGQSSTGMRVYEIFQEKCISCHNPVDLTAGLDLEGSGATVDLRYADVYNNIVNVAPANSVAASKGDRYIYPGRADRSFLFRKVNHDLDPTLTLETGEGAPMPNYQPALSETDRELIRQWILYGAPSSGTVVDEQIIEAFYSGQGEASFATPPPAPDPSEGFQIKMGPFFLKPAGQAGSEYEYFTKYELTLPDDVEVNRMDIMMSGYSHHFLLYNFNTPASAAGIPAGLRLDPFHQDIGLVAAVQEATDLALPQGTAFIWPNDYVLDLNSHYINYSASLIYQAETYINVYTQPLGTAAQEMYTSLVANGDIYIPNTGDEVSFTQTISPNLGEVYLWGMMGHTHRYGTGYKVYKRTQYQQDYLLYDAACPQGIPGCITPFFDYQHIPMRYFEPLKPLLMNFANGIIHEASWINDGPEPVWFGPTSEDEMMVMILMYTLDSAGVVISSDRPVEKPLEGVTVMPNPASNEVFFTLPPDAGNITLQLYDPAGILKFAVETPSSAPVQLDRSALPAGIYFYRILDEQGRVASGKLGLR